MNEQLGARIRQLRKERGITLTMMTERTGLSLGYLSKLENDLTSPTIAHLHKICEALGLTINDILLEKQPMQRVTIVRAAERPCIFSQDGLEYAALTKGHTILQATAMTLSGSKTYDSEPHTHDELGIVASGVLELMIGESCYRLLPGDSIYIHAGTMHSTRSGSEEPCVSYWIKTGAVADLSEET